MSSAAHKTKPTFATRVKSSVDDILTRTSWADASLALAQINKGKASGNKDALIIRTWLQKRLFILGRFIQRNPGKIIFVGLLVLSCFCVGLKSATMETDVEKLWVEEGGRLEKELKYMKKTLGEKTGSTSQIVIHTSKESGSNLLHQDAMLVHLNVIRAAIQVSVDVFDIPWSLKDMCYTQSFPLFEKHYLDLPFENLFPCAIITPLDCFWEGSKLLGPEFPVKIPGLNLDVRWTNLNPKSLISAFKNMGMIGNFWKSYPLLTVESFMERAGITTAYQEKPCLQPSDAECPKTSPNKDIHKPLDVGSHLSGGCFGFATKYMHWPEDVLVGGVSKNKSGSILRAEALQTIIQLMAEKEMYEFWRDHLKVHNLDWTVEKAKKVLESWQRKFTETILIEAQRPNVSKHNNINVFSTTSLSDIMKDFSEMNLSGIIIGYGVMVLYAFICLMKVCDPVHSQSGLGIAGVILVTLSVAAGLGFCSILSIAFNAATTQVVPFLALGIGMDNMFLIVHHYVTCTEEHSELDDQENLTGEILKRTGVNVALTSISMMCAFFAAIIIPIPALRTFMLQSGILVAFNAATMLLIFPAVVSIDIKRRRYRRVDILCCIDRDFSLQQENLDDCYKPLQQKTGATVVIPIRQTVTHALPPDGSHVVTVLASPRSKKKVFRPISQIPDILPEKQPALSQHKEPLPSNTKKLYDQIATTYSAHLEKLKPWSLMKWFVSRQLAPNLQNPSIKALTIFLCIIFLCVGGYGISQVKDGLNLTDIVPRNTNEYRFLSQQSKYFGFFNMFLVTQGNFEYPTNQQLLYEYHEAFTRIGKIIKNDNGGLPDFWLTKFRDWLLSLQTKFDEEWVSGCITHEGWCQNASDDAIMAYKLLVQTGRLDNPVDRSLLKTARLVDRNGIINSKAFYNYLSAWVSNDGLAYSATQASFVPEPRRWLHDPQDVELKMPKSQPLIYTQIPFYLNGMGTTEEITETIRNIRDICKRFEDRGLPNFPTGLPFTYWEQYLGLRHYLLMALVTIFAVVFIVIALMLFNIWAAAVVVFILAVIIVELFGFMGLIGIKLSAVPAVILIAAVGIGVEFAAHLMIGFLTSIGTREDRMVMTLEYMFCPVFHGAISTLIGVFMLCFSEFDFIFRYFFTVLCALILIGMFNGLILFPVILSIFGPPGEIIPFDNPKRISTPSPEPSPIQQRIKHNTRPFRTRTYPRIPSELSLSTITEESASCHSTEIVVQPEVVVETTTITNTLNGMTTVNTTTSSGESSDGHQSDDTSKCNSPNGDAASTTSTTTTTSGQPPGTTQTVVTTRVNATAKVKVEVHAPSMLGGEYSRHRRRRDSSSSRSSSARSSPT